MKRIIAVVGFLLILSSPAFGDIIGDTMNIKWYYPSAANVYDERTVTVVNPGVEWIAGSGAGNIDVNLGYITIENLTMGWSGSSGFNGFVFTNLTAGHDIFTSLSLVSIGGFPPPVGPILSFTDDLLSINFNASANANVYGGSGTGQLYTFAYETTSSSVPEPTTLLLLGLGLVGLAGLRRKF